MKYKFIILGLMLFILQACSNINFFNAQNIEKKEQQENFFFYDNFKVKGFVKLYIEENKIASRFNFEKNKDLELIEFLNFFNRVFISFVIKTDSVEIINQKKNEDYDILKKIIQEPSFNIMMKNFSRILSGKTQTSDIILRNENGTIRIIKNDIYTVHYKNYNENMLPILIEINFLNILINLKIENWELV